MIVCCSTVMTESLRRSTPLLLAALAVCAPVACKHKRAPEGQPTLQRASVVSVPTPAASTAKPIDASEAVRGVDRPAPTARPAPCLVEARTAYARALVLDPDDAEVLRSAADLHVRRLGARDDLELALAYVQRGLLRASKLKDRALLKDHYLGLIAERLHDDAAAAEHFARAQKLDPEAFRASPSPSVSVFAKVVQEEVSKLPKEIQAGLSHSKFAVIDLPDQSDLTATDPPLSPGILGLFRPPPEGAPSTDKPAIFLYRRNLARAAHTDEELHREVRDTLLHEVGHLNGEDDDQLRDRGL